MTAEPGWEIACIDLDEERLRAAASAAYPVFAFTRRTLSVAGLQTWVWVALVHRGIRKALPGEPAPGE